MRQSSYMAGMAAVRGRVVVSALSGCRACVVSWHGWMVGVLNSSQLQVQYHRRLLKGRQVACFGCFAERRRERCGAQTDPLRAPQERSILSLLVVVRLVHTS